MTSVVWKLIVDGLDEYADPKNLFWALLFLKNYCTKNIKVSIWDCSEKKFRKWIWHNVILICQLQIVSKFSAISFHII